MKQFDASNSMKMRACLIGVVALFAAPEGRCQDSRIVGIQKSIDLMNKELSIVCGKGVDPTREKVLDTVDNWNTSIRSDISGAMESIQKYIRKSKDDTSLTAPAIEDFQSYSHLNDQSNLIQNKVIQCKYVASGGRGIPVVDSPYAKIIQDKIHTAEISDAFPVTSIPQPAKATSLQVTVKQSNSEQPPSQSVVASDPSRSE